MILRYTSIKEKNLFLKKLTKYKNDDNKEMQQRSDHDFLTFFRATLSDMTYHKKLRPICLISSDKDPSGLNAPPPVQYSQQPQPNVTVVVSCCLIKRIIQVLI